MHSPWCLPVNGTIETIELPKRGATQYASSGVEVVANVTIRVGYALRLLLVSQCVVEFLKNGEPEISVQLMPGAKRIVPADNYDSIRFTGGGSVEYWIEDLSALERPNPGMGSLPYNGPR
jgi:hypothetical protein